MEGQRHDAIARPHIGEVVGRAVRPRDGPAGNGAFDQRHGRQVPAMLLDHKRELDEACTVTSDRLGQSHGGAAQGRELLPEVSVEAEGLGLPHSRRRALLGEELCERVADGLLFLRQREVRPSERGRRAQVRLTEG
jgi:hypothetical protein